MLGARESLAVAVIVFYSPVTPLAGYLLFKRGSKSRLPWYFLYIFCLIRLATGILEVIWQSNTGNIGLITAVIILLRVGILPLMMSTIGIFVVIRRDSFSDLKNHKIIIITFRLFVLIAVALIVAGGVLAGHVDDPSTVARGQSLTQGGYGIVAAVLVFILIYEVYLVTIGRRKLNLSPQAVKFLAASLIVWPFLVLRTVYAILSVVHTSGKSIWNAEDGSLTALIVMALIPEYCAVGIYVAAGFLIPKRKLTYAGNGEV